MDILAPLVCKLANAQMWSYVLLCQEGPSPTMWKSESHECQLGSMAAGERTGVYVTLYEGQSLDIW
jgi:hypothetical protein